MSPEEQEQKAELESAHVVAEGVCPCGGVWGAAETRSGWLVVSHTLPACNLYMNNQAPDFLRLAQQRSLEK